jgi:GAF domain-containing protein
VCAKSCTFDEAFLDVSDLPDPGERLARCLQAMIRLALKHEGAPVFARTDQRMDSKFIGFCSSINSNLLFLEVVMLPPVQLKTHDPFITPHRWLLRLGTRFYYPIAAVAVAIIIGIVVREAFIGWAQMRRMIDLILIGGACVFVLYLRAERMWARGEINWLVRFTRPDLAFIWTGLAVVLIALGLVAFIRVTGPASTAANHLWPLFLFPLLFLSERGETFPFLLVTALACILLTLLRLAVSNTFSGVVTPPLWLGVLATSNYYLARRNLLLQRRTQLLRQIANQLSNTPDVETSFEAIAELIGRRLRHDHLHLWRLDPAGPSGRLALRAAYGTPKEKWDGMSLPLTAGIPGSVWRARRPEIWEDVRKCDYAQYQPPFEWVRSALAVPILVAGEAVGVLEVVSKNQAEFWELDEEHLTLMGDSIGVALARSQHARQEAERLHDTLWTAVRELSECTSIQEMFDAIAREARVHLGADLVVLYQLAPGTGYPLTPPLFTGDFRDPDSLRQPRIPEDSVLFDLLERWEPYYSPNAPNDPLLARESESAKDTRLRFIFREEVSSTAFLPLGSRSERVGALFLHYRTRRAFSPLEKLSLEAFASLVAEPINRERAHWRKYEAFGGVMFGVHGPLTLSADSLRRLTGSAREVLRTDPVTAEAALDNAQQVARKLEMAALLTRLSKRDELDATGLREELRRAAAKLVQFMEPHEVCKIIADISPEVDDLPIAVLDALYCLAMEAVANASYHGHARRIEICVELERTRIRLTVADNGRGFDPARARHGPNGIFEAIELVSQQFGAQGRVLSEPGVGTRLEVEFPCLADTIWSLDD